MTCNEDPETVTRSRTQTTCPGAALKGRPPGTLKREKQCVCVLPGFTAKIREKLRAAISEKQARPTVSRRLTQLKVQERYYGAFFPKYGLRDSSKPILLDLAGWGPLTARQLARGYSVETVRLRLREMRVLGVVAAVKVGRSQVWRMTAEATQKLQELHESPPIQAKIKARAEEIRSDRMAHAWKLRMRGKHAEANEWRRHWGFKWEECELEYKHRVRYFQRFETHRVLREIEAVQAGELG